VFSFNLFLVHRVIVSYAVGEEGAGQPSGGGKERVPERLRQPRTCTEKLERTVVPLNT
jgi:hypothetical protein